MTKIKVIIKKSVASHHCKKTTRVRAQVNFVQIFNKLKAIT